MKFDVAISALSHAAWDWTEEGFEAVANRLGLVREPDADPAMPAYVSPWGKEWVQAIVEDGRVARLELLVEEKSPTWRPFTTRKLAALGRKFRDKLDGYIKRVHAVKGTPTFFGEPGATGFPADEDAHVLAMWPAENARLMLTMRNLGPDTPFWISIVVRPPANARLPTSRPSAPSLFAPPRRPSTSAMFRPGTVRPVSAPADGSELHPHFVTAIETIAAMHWDGATGAPLAQLASIGLPLAPSDDPQRIELVLESTEPPLGGFTEERADLLDDEYCEKFERYVEVAKEILGRPKFCDGMAARSFPSDEHAQFLALWHLKTARVMILYRNDGYDAPFTIAIAIRPR